MVRELAGHDVGRMREIVRWPAREALLAYVEHMKRIALEDYRHATTLYWLRVPSVKKPGKPPKLPPILKQG